jgi:hypothetical protein
LSDTSEIKRLGYGKTIITNVRGDPMDRRLRKAKGEQPGEEQTRIVRNAGGEDEKITYRAGPLIFSELDEPLVKAVCECTDQFIRIHGKGNGLEDAAFFYLQGERKGHFEIIELKRTLAYMDDRIVEPRFSQFLAAAPFQLNPQERALLENYITSALLL